MKQKCESRKEAIAQLVMGELAPEAAEELRQHIESCDFCRGVRDALEKEEVVVRSAFDGLAHDVVSAGSALAERFSGENQAQKDAISARPMRLGARIVKGWQKMSAINKAASVAATVAIVAGALTLLFVTNQKPAYAGYAFAQTVEAVKKVRFVHTIKRNDQGQVMNERWIEIGPNGNQARYRQDANIRHAGMSMNLLVIDDGKTCYVYDRDKNVVMLRSSGPDSSVMWIYNLGKFFDDLAGKGTMTIEQNIQYHGRPAYKVRWLEQQTDCYIDPQTRLPMTVGGEELTYEDPPADAFVVPKPPEGVKVVDMRSNSDAAKAAKLDEITKGLVLKEGLKALAAKEYARAVELLSKALELSPQLLNRNWHLYWRGDAYAGLGQWDKAVNDYAEVIRIIATNKETAYYAYLARGLALQRSGQADKAKADLGVALPVMVDALRHPEGGMLFDYADMPTDVNTALEKLSVAQRQENMLRRLQQATGQDYGFKVGMSAEEIEAAILKCEQWWEQHRSEYPAATATTKPVE